MPGVSETNVFRHNIYQTAITVNGTSAPSAAFGSQTYAIRVSSTTACLIQAGDGTPVATVNSALLPAGVIERLLVSPGQKIAFIQQAAAGVASVTELTN